MAAEILGSKIRETPIAILDFETTGLTPGYDRVVEVCVVRCEPGKEPYVALDSLVNPLRPMAATEIHGIADADVVNAPTFEELAGDLVAALSGCVMSAYNVYFDMKFLRWELGQVGVRKDPPHFCLMYLRPMLGIGERCRLDVACKAHRIALPRAHMAAADTLASAKLFQHYLSVMERRGVETFADLAGLRSYKFIRSFSSAPFAGAEAFRLTRKGKLLSRLKN